jgi:hypothetical protein
MESECMIRLGRQFVEENIGLPLHPNSRLFVKWRHHYVLYGEYWVNVGLRDLLQCWWKIWVFWDFTPCRLIVSEESFASIFMVYHPVSIYLSIYTNVFYVVSFLQIYPPPIHSKCPPISYFTWSPKRYASYMNFSAIRTGSLCLCHLPMLSKTNWRGKGADLRAAPSIPAHFTMKGFEEAWKRCWLVLRVLGGEVLGWASLFTGYVPAERIGCSTESFCMWLGRQNSLLFSVIGP